MVKFVPGSTRRPLKSTGYITSAISAANGLPQ